MATSIRLPKDIEAKLESIANELHISKSQIIKNSLKEYFTKHYSDKTSYELGKEFFGKYSLDITDLSKNRKNYIKNYLNEKMSRR
ncbi:MAG: ribbon-helix-helix domain-containing protein [Spirochaetia bacterium]|nr:ribbon-helix-helix domain-containing protein [Spirochaetia bacterium]